MSRYIAHPFAAGPPLAGGGAAPRREGVAETTDLERHVHGKILAVLFTRPGERVMRHRFGAGLEAQVFENISPLALSAIEYRIRESLEESFSEELVIEDVSIEPDDPEGTILIAIDYSLRGDRLQRRLEVIT
jgi:phage baseplate assembly protein W